jgi:hypothetical protein
MTIEAPFVEPNTTNHKTPDCKGQEAQVVMPTLI